MNDEWGGFKVIRDRNCPPGQAFFLNNEHVFMFKMKPLTRWQRFVKFIRRMGLYR